MTQVFFDMDGVLANFDAHHEAVFGFKPDKIADNVDWEKVRAVPGFYADIPPMPDFRELWDFALRLRPHPIILTGVPSSVPEAPRNKRSWVRRNCGHAVQAICTASKDKSLYCRAGDVLVDDWEKYRHLWIAAGGRWITHTSAASSIEQLLRMGIGR